MANHLADEIFLSWELKLVIKEVGYDAIADVMIKGICQKFRYDAEANVMATGRI